MAWIAKVFSQGEVFREVILIFLTIGSWHRGFDRLVKAVDELKGQGVITEDVYAQIGDGTYKPINLETRTYYSSVEFVKIISQARIVIAHAGMGTIIEATRQGKPIVVVPRQADLGEANTDHQFDTAEVLEREGKILVARETGDLPVKLKEAEDFIPTQGKDSGQVLNAVQAFIDSVIANRR